jgi:hypothetical protein
MTIIPFPQTPQAPMTRMYLPRSAYSWGDYGRILVAGYCAERENGLLSLLRTGPFVPPISFPDGIVVTDSFRRILEEEFGGLQFQPIVKKKIVSLQWEEWDVMAPHPKRLPAGGEPENYVLGRRHSEKASEQMGPLWELVVKPVLKYRILSDWKSGYSYYVLRSSCNGEPFTRFDHPHGFIIPVVTEAAKQLLEANAGQWLEFENVAVVDQLPV